MRSLRELLVIYVSEGTFHESKDADGHTIIRSMEEKRIYKRNEIVYLSSVFYRTLMLKHSSVRIIFDEVLNVI